MRLSIPLGRYWKKKWLRTVSRSRNLPTSCRSDGLRSLRIAHSSSAVRSSK